MRFDSVLMEAARGGGRTYDADALLWRDAVVTNGGAVSVARLGVVDAFVASEKASGAWALTDDYWLLCAESETQALTSLKQRRLATAVATPTFTIDRGYAFNGSSQYINTGFVPSTHAVQMTGTSQRLAAYERTNVNANTTTIGAFTSATQNLRLVTRTGTTMTGTLNSGAAAFTIATGAGYSAVSRASGGTTMLGFKNGVKGVDVTGLTVGTSLVALALYIGARNNAGSADTFRASTIGFAAVGAPLSEAQETANYNAVQAWATAIGANV